MVDLHIGIHIRRSLVRLDVVNEDTGETRRCWYWQLEKTLDEMFGDSR